MCRNIKKLRRPDRKPIQDELEAAALQFVRKVSGYPKSSKANQGVFNRAVSDSAKVTKTLFDDLVVRA